MLTRSRSEMPSGWDYNGRHNLSESMLASSLGYLTSGNGLKMSSNLGIDGTEWLGDRLKKGRLRRVLHTSTVSNTAEAIDPDPDGNETDAGVTLENTNMLSSDGTWTVPWATQSRKDDSLQTHFALLSCPELGARRPEGKHPGATQVRTVPSFALHAY